MRTHFLSLLLVLCTLLASQAAPIDSRELSVRKVKAAPKPVKAAPKPVPKPAKAPIKAAPKPAPKPVKAAPKPVPVKAAPKPVPKPVKTAPKPVPVPVKAAPKPAKAAPKPVPVPVEAAPKPVPVPVKAQPAAAPKASSKVATACPIRKGSKAGVKAREGSDPDDCSPEALCASLGDDCATCVGGGLQCAFDVKGNKCVPETTTGLTLATDKKSCATLLAAEKAAAPPTVDERVTAAAQAAFSKSVQDHIFKGAAAKKNSGRHILSAWTKANPTSKENKRDTTTGVVEFEVSRCKRDIAEKVLKISQNGSDIKTVWNDVKAADGTFVYTQDQIKTLCLRGYELSILGNPSNAATLKAPAEPAASTSKKGKGKATPAPAALKITSGLNNGFVVHNPFINQNVCINVSSASCFPLGTGTASGAEGSLCTGDAGVEE
ncbi:hypothetical protein B0H19DRAFT_1065900 [Mycena capillaripes]|nr:hypothetical protein B0H19DRAFT_1065900 [Mycena capillaripes]